MTTRQVIRCVAILAVTFLAWRTLAAVNDTALWVYGLTVAANVVFFGTLGYVFWSTHQESKRHPSTVRARLQAGYERGRAKARDTGK